MANNLSCSNCSSSRVVVRKEFLDPRTGKRFPLQNSFANGIVGGVLFIMVGIGLGLGSLYTWQGRDLVSGVGNIWFILLLGAVSALVAGIRAIVVYFQNLEKIEISAYTCSACAYVWEIQDEPLDQSKVSAIQWTGRIAGGIVLIGFVSVGILMFSSKPCEYTFEGERYKMYYVNLADGSFQDLALVKSTRAKSLFMNPDNPGGGTFEWEGNWRELKTSCSVSNFTRLMGAGW